MKKGFTLIELLAVIVILAIIATIAVPIVLNIINNSRKQALTRSAENYLRAVKYTISNEMLIDSTRNMDGEYLTSDQGKFIVNAMGDKFSVQFDGQGLQDNCKITVSNGIISNLEGCYIDNKSVTLENGKVNINFDDKKEKDNKYNVVFKIDDEQICSLELEKDETIKGNSNYSTCTSKVEEYSTANNTSFIGWYNGDNKFDIETKIDSNLTLIAKFKTITIYNGDHEDNKEYEAPKATKYKIRVSSSSEELYNFNLLKQYDNGTVSLMLDSNICSDGTFATSANPCTVTWGSSGSTGPVDAINYLNEATKNWDLIPTLTTYSSNNGVYTNLALNGHARLATYEEMLIESLPDKNGNIGQCNKYTGSCKSWMVSNLYAGSIEGYWLMDAVDTKGTYVIYYNKSLQPRSTTETKFGVRPVIVIDKSILGL